MAINSPGGVGPTTATKPRQRVTRENIAPYLAEKPGAFQVLRAGFSQENPFASAVKYLNREEAEPDDAPPGYDAFEGIEGTIFEEFPDALVGVYTPAQKDSVEKALWDQVREDQMLDDAGAFGAMSRMAGGLLDPFIAVPLGGQIKAVTGAYRVANAVGKTSKFQTLVRAGFTGKVPADLVTPFTAAATTARASAIGTAMSEAVLGATQETRSGAEIARNMTASILLGGILGGTVGHISRKGRIAALADLEEVLAQAKGEGKALKNIELNERDLINPTDGSASGAEIKMASALGLEKLTTTKVTKGLVSPVVRILVRSKSQTAKLTALEMVDSPVKFEGVVLGSSAESDILSSNILRIELFTSGSRLYREYRLRIAKEKGASTVGLGGGGRPRAAAVSALDKLSGRGSGGAFLSRGEFNSAAYRWVDSDLDDIPEATALGKLWLDKVYAPKLKEAIKEGLIDEAIVAAGTKGAVRYLNRIYLKNPLIAQGPEFKDNVIRPWLVSVMDGEEINGILKRAGVDIVPEGKLKGKIRSRTLSKLGKDTPEVKPGGDVLLPRGAKLGLNETPPSLRDVYTPQQRAALDKAIDKQVYDIFQHLTEGTRGRLPYEAMRKSSGSQSAFKGRVMDWSEADLRDYGVLETDIEVVGDRYLRTVVPDIAFKKRFGDLDLKARLETIDKEYDELMPNTPENKRVALQKQLADDKDQIVGMSQVLRGTLNQGKRSEGLSTAIRGAKAFNYITIGGQFTVNSIVDVAMPSIKNGLLRSFATGWLPFIGGLLRISKASKLGNEEARMLGTAADLFLGTRSRHAAELGTDFSNNAADDVIQAIGKKASIINLLAVWNQGMQGIVANISMTRMLKAIIAEGKGKISKRELDNLHFARLTPDIRAKIRKEISREGGMESGGGLKWSRVENWESLEAAEEWGRAVRFTVDNTILAPGAGGAPLWLSDEIGGMLGQFQRFSFGATNTILLASAQNLRHPVDNAGDFVATLNGLAFMASMGMVVEWSKNELNGRPQPPLENMEDLGDWVMSGIDRSGMLGIFGNIGHVAAKQFGAEPSSRYAHRSIPSAVAGPTFSQFESIAKLGSRSAAGNLSRGDVHTARRMLPYNQVFYINQLFNWLEKNAALSLGLPPERRHKRSRSRIR